MMGFCRQAVGAVSLEERRESFVIRVRVDYHSEPERMEVEYDRIDDIVMALLEMQEDRDGGSEHERGRAMANASLNAARDAAEGRR